MLKGDDIKRLVKNAENWQVEFKLAKGRVLDSFLKWISKLSRHWDIPIVPSSIISRRSRMYRHLNIAVPQRRRVGFHHLMGRDEKAVVENDVLCTMNVLNSVMDDRSVRTVLDGAVLGSGCDEVAFSYTANECESNLFVVRDYRSILTANLC